jgi:predicted lipoprotein with Yx(FWY)xxD motif
VSSNGVDGQWFVVNAQPVVHVFHHPTMGDILVGPTGMTLYVFDYDTKTGYECDEGCAENFPPLVVTRGAPAAQNVRSAVPAALRGGTDTMERSPDSWHGARVQVRYHGKPLYYWFRDEQPGDVSGDGIAGLWQVARP